MLPFWVPCGLCLFLLLPAGDFFPRFDGTNVVCIAFFFGGAFVPGLGLTVDALLAAMLAIRD